MTLDELRAAATGSRGAEAVWPAPLGKMSVTLETAEFLYALVRMMKPLTVLELGTGSGISARFMAEAQVKNGAGGLVVTVEPNEEYHHDARALLAGLPAQVVREYFQGLGELPDLVFVDSGYRNRDDDMTYWLQNGWGALVVVHDALRDYEQLRGHGALVPCVDGLWIGRAAA